MKSKLLFEIASLDSSRFHMPEIIFVSHMSVKKKVQPQIVDLLKMSPGGESYFWTPVNPLV